MGRIRFVKTAGSPFPGDDPPGDGATAEEPGSVEELFAEQERDRRRGSALEQRLRGLGLEAEDLLVGFHEGHVEVSGKAATQADRERIALALGNLKGVAEVSNELQVEEDAPESFFYTVRSGDTLSKIAAEHYGASGRSAWILDANRPIVSGPAELHAGMVLRLPEDAGVGARPG